MRERELYGFEQPRHFFHVDWLSHSVRLTRTLSGWVERRELSPLQGGCTAATAGTLSSSFDDVSGLIPQTPASTAMNDLSVVNRFYSDHARACLRWIGCQGRILRPCVTLFRHRSVQRSE